jgi:hypothetical protein
MADKDIAFKLEIDGVEQSIKSVKDLKGAIKALQDEAESADIGSENYKNAIENIEKLNDKLQEVTRTEKQAAQAMEDMANAEKEATKETQDLRKQFEVLEDELFLLAGQGKQNTEEFRNLSSEAAKLNAKIDEVNQTLGTGASGIDKLGGSFSMLSEGLTSLNFDKIKTGFKGLSSAMSAIPLMLIVSGITMLMEKFDVFGKITEVITDIIYAFTDAIGLTNKADEKAAAAIVENAQKVQTAKEAQYDTEIKKAQAAGQSTKQLELDKLKSTEDSIAKQVKAMEDLQIKKGTLNDEEQKNYDELQINLLKASSDREAKEIANNKAKVDEINAYNTLQSNIAEDLRVAKLSEREKEIDAIRKASAAKLKELQDKEVFNFNQSGKAIEEQLRKNKETEKQINELAQIEINKINAKYNKEAADKKKEQDAILLAESDAFWNAEVALQKEYAKEKYILDKKEIDDQIALEEAQRLQDEAMVAGTQARNEQARLDKLAKDKAARDAELAGYAELEKEKFNLAKQGIEGVQALSDMYFLFRSQNAQKGSKEEAELAKKAFNVNKALQLATATINGIQAVQGAFATATASPITTVFPAYPFIQAGLAGVLSAANIAKIAASKFESASSGGGGGSVSAPSAPSIPAPPISTASNNTNQSTLFDESGQNLGFKPKQQINVTATVGVDEIANKTNRVSVLEQQSTF